MTVPRRLWRLRERHPLFVATATLLCLALFAYPFVDYALRDAGIAPPFRFWDFGAYNAAINRWLTGEAVYVRNENGGYHSKYIYPPVVLLLFLPFTSLTFSAAALAWEVFAVLFLWGSLQLAVGALGLDLRWWERLALLWLLLGFQPLLLGLKLGQTPAFLTGLLCLALAFAVSDERGGNEFVSGFLTALAAGVKLPYAPAGAHLLRGRRRFLGAIAGGLSFVAVSLAVFGLSTNLQFLEVLKWGLEAGTSARSPRLWLPPYYRPFFSVPHATAIRVLVAGGISAAVILAGPGVERESFALGAAAVPLLAPQTYVYYFVAAIPAVVALVAAELDRAGRPTLPLIGVVLLGVHSYGLKVIVENLPSWIPPSPEWAVLLTAVQPGLWGNWLLVGLAGVRVLEAVELPVPSLVGLPARFR
ncbi:MAG: glycosyltransferase family 87 protein [Halobaculum sp.]